jgi:PAS domain-containing protein
LYFQRDQELQRNPGEQIYEAQMKRQDGSTCNVILNKAVIRNNDNDIVGIVGSIHDITELKKTQKHLEKAQESMEISSYMLHKISAGIVIIDDRNKVVDSNESFAKLMGEETEELFETIPGLKGASVEGLVPEVIFKMLSNLLISGEENLERDFKYQNKLLHISAVTLYKNKVVGAVIRDMSAPMLVRDEIINRAQRIIKQNIETVQKAAFLLGENAAETEELLYSIIESYRYDDDE